MRLLVTGATGKVGQAFLPAFLSNPRFAKWNVVALCNNRALEPGPRVSVVKGSMADPQIVGKALEGVTHVLHLAAVKETPDQAIDVALKGLYLLLEGFSRSAAKQQFMLLSGDCVVGHIFHGYSAPITEQSPRRAYRGVYALTKVLEETMVEQFGIQEGLNWTTLRAPWIMEKDDFRYVLSFGDDQFGGPGWETLISPAERRLYATHDNVPILVAGDGKPLKRNFVHVDDLVSAMLAVIDHPAARQQLFNIAMTRPVDYQEVADHLSATRGLRGVPINTNFCSNALDNAKARHMLAWEPEYDLAKLIDTAFAYQRTPQDVRKIWYAG